MWSPRTVTDEETWRDVGPRESDVALVELLRRGADCLERGVAVPAPLRERWAALLGGGLPGLRAVDAGTGWLQLGLTPAGDGRRPELYRAVWDLVGELEADGVVEEFFFMHKPPGLRLRVRAAAGAMPAVRHLAETRAAQWQVAGVLAGHRYGVYEPEYLLFGGPVSMRSVHRVFTADSRVWLPLHAAGAAAGPAWAVALLTTRALLAALRVDGWERLDVADRLHRQTGRGLSAEALALPRVTEVFDRMRGAWANPDLVRALLPDTTLAAVDTYADAVREESRRWRAAYFDTPSAVVGPREMAAFALVFQWNRAGLDMPRQHLLTAVLADRPGSAP